MIFINQFTNRVQTIYKFSFNKTFGESGKLTGSVGSVDDLRSDAHDYIRINVKA